MFEKIGNAWVRRLKACVAVKGFFLNSGLEAFTSSQTKTQRKNTSFNTSFATPWHATQTQTTHAFPKSPSQILKWAQGPIELSQNPRMPPSSPPPSWALFFFERPEKCRKHSLTMNGAELE